MGLQLAQLDGPIDLYGASAPEIPAELEWLNTDRPLSLAQLRGKVVLLDFWTYGCINCIHNFDDLERFQAEFPDELVIIRGSEADSAS
jgi:thiol-disulfide isomerase/thioredoxin